MIVEVIPVGALQVNCVVIGCPVTHKAALVDPGADVEQIVQALDKHGLSIELILNTHGHFDHIGANVVFKERSGAPLLIHRADVPLLQLASAQAAAYGLQADNSPAPDRMLDGGELLQVGELEIEVLHTPGHSPGGVCYYLDGLVVSGDTLFAGSIGRTDLPGGDYGQLLQSIHDKLAGLPSQTRVVPGHGPLTRIGDELKYNPFLNGEG